MKTSPIELSWTAKNKDDWLNWSWESCPPREKYGLDFSEQYMLHSPLLGLAGPHVPQATGRSYDHLIISTLRRARFSAPSQSVIFIFSCPGQLNRWCCHDIDNDNDNDKLRNLKHDIGAQWLTIREWPGQHSKFLWCFRQESSSFLDISRFYFYTTVVIILYNNCLHFLTVAFPLRQSSSFLRVVFMFWQSSSFLDSQIRCHDIPITWHSFILFSRHSWVFISFIGQSFCLVGLIQASFPSFITRNLTFAWERHICSPIRCGGPGVFQASGV